MTRALFTFAILTLLVPAPASSGGGGVEISARLLITNEDQFDEHVAGNRAEASNGDWFIAQENGRLTGSIDGLQLKARWSFKGTTWCKIGSAGSLKLDACYKLELDGDRLRERPVQGGNSMTYKLRF